MQYAGEGGIFLLLIVAGAIFVYRSVKKQLRLSQQQQSFMMGVTHELKTPVAIAKLNLETLRKRVLENDQQQKLMSNTLQEINRLDDLCNNMLVSSQIEAGAYSMVKEKLDLGECISEITTAFRNRYPAREITYAVEGTAMISADEELIKIMIGNLVENALKYSPKQSPVSIITETLNNITITRITDNGPGIPKEEIKKVFRKFYRVGNEATRSSKGTGIGLYLVHNLVKAHKGKVYITDNPKGGSIFNIEIPLA